MDWGTQFLSMNYSIKYFDNIGGLTWVSEDPRLRLGVFCLADSDRVVMLTIFFIGFLYHQILYFFYVRTILALLQLR